MINKGYLTANSSDKNDEFLTPKEAVEPLLKYIAPFWYKTEIASKIYFSNLLWKSVRFNVYLSVLLRRIGFFIKVPNICNTSGFSFIF